MASDSHAEITETMKFNNMSEKSEGMDEKVQDMLLAAMRETRIRNDVSDTEDDADDNAEEGRGGGGDGHCGVLKQTELSTCTQNVLFIHI